MDDRESAEIDFGSQPPKQPFSPDINHLKEKLIRTLQHTCKYEPAGSV